MGWVPSLILLWSFGLQTAQSQVEDPKSGLEVTGVDRISRISGASLPGEDLPNPTPNSLAFNVGGTDLGIFWEFADGTIGCFFGDTNGNGFKPTKQGGGNGGDWRANVLAFSTDTTLGDGLEFSSWATDSKGHAREIVPSEKDTSGKGDWTSIPTSAISVLGREFVHYMNVRRWGRPGEWETNYSSFHRSDDLGRHWAPMDEVQFSGDSRFAQVALAKKDGFVFMIGTPSGRLGSPYLVRIKEADFPKLDEFEYWGNGAWQRGDESLAEPIFPAPVGEISLVHHPGFKKWIALYMDHHKVAVVMRTADRPEGPWSEQTVLAQNRDYPGLYGSFIHPASLKGNTLYFSMSLWHPYNVFLMKADLRAQD